MSAHFEIEKRHEIVGRIKEEKPFGYIVQNLENTFGEPQPPPKSDALAMLIEVILSQATTDVNSRRTYQNLRKRFKNWDNVSRG